MKKCIILANGKPPRKQIVAFLLRKGYSTLICADGGANHARKMNLVPDYIIGDLDSISAITLKYYQAKSDIIKLSRQNDTDVEKAIKLAISKQFDEAVLLGVTGDRLDHTFCNLGIVLKFFDKIRCMIIAENSILFPLSKLNIIKSIPGETISLYGFNKKTKISTAGLKYSLSKTALPFGERESTSNVSISNTLKISIKGGIIFLIRDFNFLKTNDLF
ncbi:MAG TPA: thiamine diphosphokinase [Ignavibacteriaceae bacterium]|nr:thiamine diphosphokinase [Ignavibacteriaceae bacterium]